MGNLKKQKFNLKMQICLPLLQVKKDNLNDFQIYMENIYTYESNSNFDNFKKNGVSYLLIRTQADCNDQSVIQQTGFQNYGCLLQTTRHFTNQQLTQDGINLNSSTCNCNPSFQVIQANNQNPPQIPFTLSVQQQITDIIISYTIILDAHTFSAQTQSLNIIALKYGTQNFQDGVLLNPSQIQGCGSYSLDYKKVYTNLNNQSNFNIKFNLAFSLVSTDHLQGITDLTIQVNYQCPLYCSSCDNNRNCLACLNNYYKSLNPNTNLYYCKMPCPPGQYATLPDQFTQFQTCNSCIQNCQSCNSDQDCLACNNGYEFISKIVQCLLKCNSNQYRDANSQCQNCMANCQQCSGPQDCSICNNNFTFDSTSLQCICPKIGYFLDSNGDDSVIKENYEVYLVPGILSYQVSSTTFIDTFYLLKVSQSRDQNPYLDIQYDQVQNTCNDISFSIQPQNDAQRGFFFLQWSIQVQPLLEASIQSQVDSIIQTANSQKSLTLIFEKYLLPPDSLLTIQLSYTLKVNWQGTQTFTTNYVKAKQIVLSTIQSQYPPIYRYKSLSVVYSFYVQTCDQKGPTIFIEPLNIQLQSQATPTLNQNYANFSDTQIQVDIQPYSIPISSTLDLNPNITFKNSSDNKLFRVLTTNKDAINNQAINASIVLKFPNAKISSSSSNFYKASSRVLPIKSLNDQDEFQRQSYASINQLQILKNQQTNQQEIQNEQLQYQANEVISKKDSRQIQSQPSVSLKNFELDKDQEILAQNQTVLQAISKNNQQDDELKSKKSVKSDNLSKIVDNLINKNDNENQPSVNNFKINQKKTFSINTETNINANKETAVRIASNVLNEQMLQNKETSKKNSIVEQQILSDEMKQQNQDNQEQQKKEEEDFLAVQMYMSYPVMIRILVFHDFFSIFFLYDKLMSRSVRFTIYYIRMIHSLSISTIFSQQYNEVQMIMVSILNSVVLQISLGIIKLSYKIKKVGKYVCTFSMITLCLFYYYVILSIVSGQDSPSSNSKIASFFIIVAVDFLAFGTSVSTLKMLIASHMLNKANRFNIIMKLFSLLNLQESIENLSI
ncbi:hypothetical protein ABPG73_008365 [Tetrahymena malaccensis]